MDVIGAGFLQPRDTRLEIFGATSQFFGIQCMLWGGSGKKIAYPLLVAPMAMQRLAHPDGELATSRAAAAEGIPMVCNNTSSC